MASRWPRRRERGGGGEDGGGVGGDGGLGGGLGGAYGTVRVRTVTTGFSTTNSNER